MKINVKVKNDYVARIPVWFGKIEDGMVVRNGRVDFEQSKRRTTLKNFLKHQEEVEVRLNKWAREAGF